MQSQIKKMTKNKNIDYFKLCNYFKKKVLLDFILKKKLGFCGFFHINFISYHTYLEFKRILSGLDLRIFSYKKSRIGFSSLDKLIKGSTHIVYSVHKFEFLSLKNRFFDFLYSNSTMIIPLYFFVYRRFLFLDNLQYFKQICSYSNLYIQLYYILKFFISKLIYILNYDK